MHTFAGSVHSSGGAQRAAAVPLPCSCVTGRGPSVYCYRPCVAVATLSIIFHLCHCLPCLPYIPTYSSIFHRFQCLPIPPMFCPVLCTIVAHFSRRFVIYSTLFLCSCNNSIGVLVCCLSPAPSAGIPARCRGVVLLSGPSVASLSAHRAFSCPYNVPVTI